MPCLAAFQAEASQEHNRKDHSTHSKDTDVGCHGLITGTRDECLGNSLYEGMCTITCVSCALRNQKRVLDPLELVLQMVVNYPSGL